MTLDTVKNIPTTLWNVGGCLASGGANVFKAGYSKILYPLGSGAHRLVVDGCNAAGPFAMRIKDTALAALAVFAAFISNGFASCATFCATYQATLIPLAAGVVAALALVYIIGLVARSTGVQTPAEKELNELKAKNAELEKIVAGEGARIEAAKREAADLAGFATGKTLSTVQEEHRANLTKSEQNLAQLMVEHEAAKRRTENSVDTANLESNLRGQIGILEREKEELNDKLKAALEEQEALKREKEREHFRSDNATRAKDEAQEQQKALAAENDTLKQRLFELQVDLSNAAKQIEDLTEKVAVKGEQSRN